jgi:hypothetical protein
MSPELMDSASWCFPRCGAHCACGVCGRAVGYPCAGARAGVADRNIHLPLTQMVKDEPNLSDEEILSAWLLK